MASRSSTRPEIAELDRHRRRAYLLLLGLSIPVLIVVLLVENPTDPFVRAMYPALIVLLDGLLVAVVRRWIRLSLAGTGILVIAGGGVVLRLVDLLLAQPGPLADRLLIIAGGHYWAFTVLLVLGFLLFDRRTGLAIGAGLWTGSLALAVAAMLRDSAAEQLTTQVVIYLGRVHVFLAVVLTLVAGSAALREQLDRALERAEVLSTQAMTDPLTRLANRSAGNARLTDESADAQRRDRPLTIVLFDMGAALLEGGSGGLGDVVVGVAGAVGAVVFLGEVELEVVVEVAVGL